MIILDYNILLLVYQIKDKNVYNIEDLKTQIKINL